MAPDEGGPFDTCELCGLAIHMDVYGSAGSSA